MKTIIVKAVTLILLICVAEKLHAQSQNASTNPEINKLRLAIEANPNSEKLHKDYYRLAWTKKGTIEQYEKWAKRFSTSAMTHYYLGKLYDDSDRIKAAESYQNAVRANPKMKEAWKQLWLFYTFTGNDSLRQKYSFEATKANPTDTEMAFLHAQSYAGLDEVKFDSLSMSVIRRFPASDEAAQSFYTLYQNASDPVIRRIYLDQAYKLYLTHQTPTGAELLSTLYTQLLFPGTEKALDLALEMIRVSKQDLLKWNHRAESAKKLYKLKQLVKEKKVPEAIALFNSIEMYNTFAANSLYNNENFLDLQMELYALNGETKRAFDTLSQIYSTSPAPRTRVGLLKYGSELGMDSTAVFGHIWTFRERKSELADTLNLTDMRTNERVTMKDYRGKIVLITNWFPSCGPCRKEFPHFENVLKKYPQVAYIGINGLPEENNLVLPFLEGTRFTFRPLDKGATYINGIHVLGNLQPPGGGYPSNFLIDQRGKIIFRKFQTSTTESEQTLEAMIKEMIERNLEEPQS